MPAAIRRLRSVVGRWRGTDQLSQATVFELLRNKRRRYAFHYLRQQADVVTLAELSDHVAAWEYKTTVGELDSDARQRVYVSLFQTHLPRMDSAGVVEFDKEDGRVELSDAASTIEIYLETVPEREILWAHHYLGLTVLAGVFLGFLWVDVRPFSDYQLVVWLFVLGMFLVSAVLHHLYLSQRRLGAEGPPPTEL